MLRVPLQLEDRAEGWLDVSVVADWKVQQETIRSAEAAKMYTSAGMPRLKGDTFKNKPKCNPLNSYLGSKWPRGGFIWGDIVLWHGFHLRQGCGEDRCIVGNIQRLRTFLCLRLGISR